MFTDALPPEEPFRRKTSTHSYPSDLSARNSTLRLRLLCRRLGSRLSSIEETATIRCPA